MTPDDIIEIEHIDASDVADRYVKDRGRKILFLAMLALLVFACVLISIRLGATDLTYGDILRAIFTPDGSWNTVVVVEWRLPVAIAAILVGAILGLAGAVMQGVLRNPMASPFTLGISNASAFGAAIGILFLNGGIITGSWNIIPQISNPGIVALCAFAFALLATFIIIILIKFTDSKPETIVLAGLAISSIFAAGLAFLQYVSDETSMAAIVFWQFGSLEKASWGSIKILLIILVMAFVIFFIRRWDLNAMETGDDVARGLGVNTERTRIFCLILSSLITAVAVSFFGIIGFIGLIGPHIVKKIIGNDFRYVLIGSMLIGSLVLLISNVVATHGLVALIETTLPVGILTSAIGGPLFIAILISGSRRRSC